MSDRITGDKRRANMRAIRSKGMKPELKIRRLVHSMGYRYRLHRHDLPGRPDMVFPSRQKIIQINGCFWHQHSDPSCLKAHIPKSNTEYWLPKLEKNKKRDDENLKRLMEMGWKILVIWECELSNNIKIKKIIKSFLA